MVLKIQLHQKMKVILRIPDRPVCRQTIENVYEANKHQTLKIECKMISNPGNSLQFAWSFNNSINSMDIPVRFTFEQQQPDYYSP